MFSTIESPCFLQPESRRGRAGERTFSKIRNLALVLSCFLVLCLASVQTATAQDSSDEDFVRPPANKILPEETLLYARIPSFPAFFEEFGKSGFSNMVQDERVAPLIDSVYQDLKKEYDDKVKDELGGLDLEKFKDFATGELCFAMVAKRRKPLHMVMFFDVPEESDTLDRILGVAEEKGVEKGDVELEEDHGVKVHYFNFEGMRLLQFRVANTVFFCNDEKLCQELISNIHGKPLKKTRTFDKNRKYRSIMSTCKVTKENPALISYFVDPIALTKASLRGSGTGVMVTGALPVLGLDGILGFGGATLKGDDQFEANAHLHMLMANPRKGLLKAISLKKSSMEISPLVPEDAGMIMQVGLDVPKLYNGIRTITDTFGGEDTFDNQIENASNFMGFDVKTELIDQFNGDLSLFNWTDPASTAFNSNSNAYLIGYRDRAKAMEVFGMIREKAKEDSDKEQFSEFKYKGIDYFMFASFEDSQERRRKRREEREAKMEPEERQRRQDRRRRMQKMFRMPRPAFAFFEDHLIISDNENLLKHIIDTAKGKVGKLSDQEDYKIVKEHCERMLDGKKPSGFFFSRPAKQLGPLWEVLRGDSFKEMAGAAADREAERGNGDLVQRLNDSLNNHELPSFSEFNANFPAQGGYIIDDATGLHMFTFGLKPELDKKKK